MSGKPQANSSSEQAEDLLLKQSPEMIDVWSRWGGRYRGRAAVLLGVNTLLFLGVCVFAYWLRSGVVFAPGMEGYWDELSRMFALSGPRTVSLGDQLVHPIGVQEVPAQIPILGMLMASLIAVPILVSLLYRFWSAVPLIVCVGFVAMMPWLAITLVISCTIASVKPFRFSIRFISALLGLVPATVYLILASMGTEEVFIGRLDPVERIKFVAPWVLAIVSAALLFAVVLALAKVVNHRPGVLAPLLAAMFVLPVALFEYHVGRDELNYRLLEDHFRWAFADWDASQTLEKAVAQRYWSQPLPKRSYEEIRQLEEQSWQFDLASDLQPRRNALALYQQDLKARCDKFIRNHPYSRYLPNVLFLSARTTDMRIDAVEFRNTHWVRFYDSFPNTKSRPTWEKLIANTPVDSKLRAMALLRLAQFDARNGDIDRAKAKLAELIAQFDDEPTTALLGDLEVGGGPNLFVRGDATATLHIPMHQLILDAYRLYDLLLKNRDPIWNYDPLCGSPFASDAKVLGFLQLDPRAEGYSVALKSLKETYPRSELADNIDLELALAENDPHKRIELLESLIARWPGRDAMPEALFRLGAGHQGVGASAVGRSYLERLIIEYGDSIWARQARGRIKLPPTTLDSAGN